MERKIHEEEHPHIDPKVRMLEIRAYLKKFFKGKAQEEIKHLGEFPQTMADARRTIVALQDMYEESCNRHRKASDLVRDAVDAFQELERKQANHNAVVGLKLMFRQKRLDFQASKIQELTEKVEALTLERHELMAAISASKGVQQELRQKLEAALSTVKTLMTGF